MSQAGQFRKSERTEVSAYHRGCVKTCSSEERAALFSLLPFLMAVVSAFIFQTDEIEKDFLHAA